MNFASFLEFPLCFLSGGYKELILDSAGSTAQQPTKSSKPIYMNIT